MPASPTSTSLSTHRTFYIFQRNTLLQLNFVVVVPEHSRLLVVNPPRSFAQVIRSAIYSQRNAPNPGSTHHPIFPPETRKTLPSRHTTPTRHPHVQSSRYVLLLTISSMSNVSDHPSKRSFTHRQLIHAKLGNTGLCTLTLVFRPLQYTPSLWFCLGWSQMCTEMIVQNRKGLKARIS